MNVPEGMLPFVWPVPEGRKVVTRNGEAVIDLRWNTLVNFAD